MKYSAETKGEEHQSVQTFIQECERDMSKIFRTLSSKVLKLEQENAELKATNQSLQGKQRVHL